MKLYKHESYEEYRKIQEDCAINGENNVWVSDKELELLANHIASNVPNAKFGLCHGVRNGYEVEHLKKQLSLTKAKKITMSTDPSDFFVQIIGTEISKFALKYEDVIQWDFHDVKDEWLKKADFIYSNSFDHSHKPKYALRQWFSCLKPSTGLLYLHHGGEDYPKDDPTPADCFVATLEEFKDMILEIEGTFIKDIIDIPIIMTHPSGRPHMGRPAIDKIGRNCGNHNTVHGLKIVVAGINK